MKMFLRALPLLVLASVAAAEIKIYTPADKLLTYSELIILRGKASRPGELVVNNIYFPAKADGTFSGGLILSPGKNLLEIKDRKEARRLRLLRLKTYPDIDGHWAEGQIAYLATLGIIEGYPEENFYPASAITRGEFATWLAKAKRLTVAPPAQDAFFDVPKEHWRGPFIKAVADAGYIIPYAHDTFGVDAPISRREAAEIAVRVEGLEVAQKITPLFKDVSDREKGAAPIYTARQEGLVVGIRPDITVFDPERALTRAEGATIISRFPAIQDRIGFLANFGKGFEEDKLCRLNIAPAINSFSAFPGEARAGQSENLRLRVEIAPRGNFTPIAKVKVDLSAIGGLPDAEMYDDATGGDEAAGDGIYSLNLTFIPGESGEKILRAAAIDQVGWEGKAEAKILIMK